MATDVKNLPKEGDSGEVIPSNFIRNIIEEDIRTGKNGGRVHTRFPPEPSGYLHIGHAKAIVADFGFALDYNGMCNLRFDDTNPIKEELEYEESIKEDVKWLGYDWQDRLYYASDYFETLYGYAVELIKKGKAYICELNADEMREYRGTLSAPGKDSPFRNRSVEENLELFQAMREGKFSEGTKTLRAKIDMSSPNINMRDPVMYRILFKSHHRTQNQWCIYPSYDFTHGQCDSLEGITHSMCTLEFEDHRPLYDWFVKELGIHHPQQIEFAKLRLTYTMTSKRFLRKLVDENYVMGWDDPRLPSLRGMRRRGYTPEAIKDFCKAIGLGKQETTIAYETLEYYVREDLKHKSPHRNVILRPLKVTITNWNGADEELSIDNHPNKPEMGKRNLFFSQELFIESDDFREVPSADFFRLVVGGVVKLRGGYVIKCNGVVKDEASGEVVELLCEYVPNTLNEIKYEGKKIKGIIHWLSAVDAIDAEVRLFDRLFTKENLLDLNEGEDYLDFVDKNSLTTLKNCKVEYYFNDVKKGESFQFVRSGYFTADIVECAKGNLVFNRTVSLK